MAGDDKGWLGHWQPMIVQSGSLDELQNLAGQPILGKSGRPLEWCAVNLRTGEFRYPVRIQYAQQ